MSPECRALNQLMYHLNSEVLSVVCLLSLSCAIVCSSSTLTSFLLSVVCCDLVMVSLEALCSKFFYIATPVRIAAHRKSLGFDESGVRLVQQTSCHNLGSHFQSCPFHDPLQARIIEGLLQSYPLHNMAYTYPRSPRMMKSYPQYSLLSRLLRVQKPTVSN